MARGPQPRHAPDQGHVQGLLIDVVSVHERPVVAELLPVIGRHHQQRLVQDRLRLEEIEHASQLGVDRVISRS